MRCWRFCLRTRTSSSRSSSCSRPWATLHPDAAYRALDRLVEEGTARRFAPESGGSAAYQAMDPGHCDAHLHLKCVGCGRLIHLDTGVSDALQADLLRAAGFTVDGRSTTIYGTCAACGGKRGGHA